MKLLAINGSSRKNKNTASLLGKIVGPFNAKRGNFNTPCVKTGRCHDCNSLERICRGMVIHLRPML